MESTFWYKQTADQPLFPDMLWSKPENKQHAGKLLIVGGNLHGFAAVGEAYRQATKTGAGVVKILLPNVLQKTVGMILDNTAFAPSNKSGSFSRPALAEWLSLSAWADSVLIAGDLGRNSETAVVLESFANKYAGQLVLTKDAADYFAHQPGIILQRTDTLLVLSLAQLQKMCLKTKWPEPILFSMTIQRLVQVLHEMTRAFSCVIVVEHNGLFFVAYDGKVSTTKHDTSINVWRVKTAAHAAVWQLQNPGQPFEAITTAMYEI